MNLERLARSGTAERPPLVFVHGAWHAAWCWDEHYLDWFAARGFECHAFSLRGHGASGNDRSLRTTRVDHYVADLAGVVERLERPPVLIGHSLGGLVVQRYLIEHEVPAAVLLAPVPVGGALGVTLRMIRRHPLAFLKANATLRLWPIVETPELARDAFFADDHPETETDQYWSMLQDESYLAYLDMVAFRRPRPGRVTTPVLVVGGEQDRVFTVAEMQRTARAYRADLEMIPGAAHDLMLDPRWEQSAAAIAGWLEGRLG